MKNPASPLRRGVPPANLLTRIQAMVQQPLDARRLVGEVVLVARDDRPSHSARQLLDRKAGSGCHFFGSNPGGVCAPAGVAGVVGASGLGLGGNRRRIVGVPSLYERGTGSRLHLLKGLLRGSGVHMPRGRTTKNGHPTGGLELPHIFGIGLRMSRRFETDLRDVAYAALGVR